MVSFEWFSFVRLQNSQNTENKQWRHQKEKTVGREKVLLFCRAQVADFGRFVFSMCSRTAGSIIRSRVCLKGEIMERAERERWNMGTWPPKRSFWTSQCTPKYIPNWIPKRTLFGSAAPHCNWAGINSLQTISYRPASLPWVPHEAKPRDLHA